jgi:hypothetical protein
MQRRAGIQARLFFEHLDGYGKRCENFSEHPARNWTLRISRPYSRKNEIMFKKKHMMLVASNIISLMFDSRLINTFSFQFSFCVASDRQFHAAN